jgi:hypothetical protein
MKKVVRTTTRDVWLGEIEKRDGDNIVLTDARRLWFWSGAASLSQLAMEGVKNPGQCKFPRAVDRVELFGVIEILDCTDVAIQNLEEVRIWEI